MSRKPFTAEFGLRILGLIVQDPPSDEMLDTACMNEIRSFVQSGEADPVAVWNFYKRMMDAFVRFSAAAPFVMNLFDLEEHYEPPAGALLQSDGTILQAPWRLDPSLVFAKQS